jgi:serine/threonine protein kinase
VEVPSGKLHSEGTAGPLVTPPAVCPPVCVTGEQGGVSLAFALTVLKQAVAGLMHLHSLGVLHRDLRAANLLLDSLDPVQVRLADFGVSHLLSSFAGAGPGLDVSAGRAHTVLRGGAALGPMLVGRRPIPVKLVLF